MAPRFRAGANQTFERNQKTTQEPTHDKLPRIGLVDYIPYGPGTLENRQPTKNGKPQLHKCRYLLYD